MARDAVSFTKSLLRFDTVNPPGRERDCARHVGTLLNEWGFRVDYHEYDERRTSVVARAGATVDPDDVRRLASRRHEVEDLVRVGEVDYVAAVGVHHPDVVLRKVAQAGARAIWARERDARSVR